ncbi:TPA: triphosphoribosyl-dephospho-CoA synthase, partial [Streptococcus equi subsp. zooepidemicus]|nr:triphosphoribosyl-dephospho-CoA synthase [Streptococcus equi subsp. zooepidemicus]
MTKKVFDDISRLALKALLYEVSLSPKPGLVDQLDNGAHDDMSFLTFVDSALALAPFFKTYLDIGFYHAKEDPGLIFERLRVSGIEAEQAMFSATKGVNTHKGVNFSLALLLGATGMYLASQPQLLAYVTAFTEEDSLAICQLV